MSYSQGPWKLEVNGHRYLISCPTEGWVIRMDASTMAAFHQRGNAQLIAAAPDLLEELKNLLKVIDGEGGTHPNAQERARAVIAKAEGRS